MRRDTLPLESLPAWCLLNDVSLAHCKVGRTAQRGFGLIADKELGVAPESAESSNLLTVPRDLVLSAEAVEGFAKENQDFRQLLHAAGHQSHRQDILLFLLMQLVLSSPDVPGKKGASTPWAQYFSLLPQYVPVPTMWTDAERAQLRGTSLESAVSAKLAMLAREFDSIKAKLVDSPLWSELFLDDKVTAQDWVLLDALYRSRSLELPKSGISMVPCLDQANHAAQHNAYYEEGSAGEVMLRLVSGAHLSDGEEITINYGLSKSPAEMLFSYGFIDSDSSVEKLTLPLELTDDDPLLKAKIHVYGQKPSLDVQTEGGVCTWSAPFVYLMCLNEEDGVEFKVLQENNGSQHLRMFWQDEDITETPASIHQLAMKHDLWPIFELRAVTVVLGTIEDQLARLPGCTSPSAPAVDASPETALQATQLQKSEASLLRTAVKSLEDTRSLLLENGTVLAYLEAMQNAQGESTETHEDEDFS